MKQLKEYFHPTKQQLKMVKNWLSKESINSGDGFYNEWQNILTSFEKKQLAIISSGREVAGFATWRFSSSKTATIDLFEIKPSLRRNGIGEKFANKILSHFRSKEILAADLIAGDKIAKLFWKQLGFNSIQLPEEHFDYKIDTEKHMYIELIETLPKNSNNISNESIEIWNSTRIGNNDFKFKYTWNLEFINGTRKLLKPIIIPAIDTWNIKWTVHRNVKFEEEIKKIKPNIFYDSYLILEELSL